MRLHLPLIFSSYLIASKGLLGCRISERSLLFIFFFMTMEHAVSERYR